jgi:hypothetical protein
VKLKAFFVLWFVEIFSLFKIDAVTLAI